jgi:UPF0042 nucleotide-binding protein
MQALTAPGRERGLCMQKNLILITGMSGAGKTSAMNALEDLGYLCIDNFPKELLPSLQSLLEKNEERYAKLALSVSAQDYLEFVNFFEQPARPLQLVFIDASDEELLLRYRFTRRQHPLIVQGKAATLEEAIEIERDDFEHLKALRPDTFHIDSTKLSAVQLANSLRQYIQSDPLQEFAVTFQSFGFKNGVPMDADEIIDVRFLPNPFYEQSLRNKNGNDAEVYDYVMGYDETQQFLKVLDAYLDFVFDTYKAQHKNHMIVSIGCTGGQHRSVSGANYLTNRYKERYRVFCNHRDIVEGGEQL